jgi:CheY-like chemotaxis protein
MGRILIVDDSSTVRLRLRKAVAMLGHESVAVVGGPRRHA